MAAMVRDRHALVIAAKVDRDCILRSVLRGDEPVLMRVWMVEARR